MSFSGITRVGKILPDFFQDKAEKLNPHAASMIVSLITFNL